ncbi:MAG: AmmeMemoRadiSam system protein A [Anaerolineae bacterium]|nr:AmmeMemoRadiSam system protein A [Anaerolineae bacterium]
MSSVYSPEEQTLVLKLARQALEAAAAGRALDLPDLAALPPALQAERACFVTLHTTEGELRGCTGTLAARQPLAYEVCHITVQTALHDPRFSPVQPVEVSGLVIEVSILTPPQPLAFDTPEAIPGLLRPHVDGVILITGGRRATFLPQVWEKAPEPVMFLDLLCHKAGLPAGMWRQPGVQVLTYRTIVIEEASDPA